MLAYLKHHLKHEIGLHTLKPGTRLPAVRQIAAAADVSHGTARNILQKLASQGYVEIKPGSGTVWIREPQEPNEFIARSSELVIGVNTFQADNKSGSLNKSWQYRIHGGITHGALMKGVSLRLKHLLERPQDVKDEVQLHLHNLKGVDGFILFPFYGFRQLERILTEKKIPFVYFNPPHYDATKQFVSHAYFEISERLGKIWGHVKKKRVLTFFSPGPEKSVSCQFMSAGLMSGLAMNQIRLPEIYKLTISQSNQETAAKAFGKFIDKGWIPDAVLCKSDIIALGVLEMAQIKGIGVPEQMSVVGGNGMSYYEPSRSPLTAFHQPLEEIGEHLIEMLAEQITHPHIPQPGVYLKSTILVGDTTTQKENHYIKKFNLQK